MDRTKSNRAPRNGIHAQRAVDACAWPSAGAAAAASYPTARSILRAREICSTIVVELTFTRTGERHAVPANAPAGADARAAPGPFRPRGMTEGVCRAAPTRAARSGGDAGDPAKTCRNKNSGAERKHGRHGVATRAVFRATPRQRQIPSSLPFCSCDHGLRNKIAGKKGSVHGKADGASNERNRAANNPTGCGRAVIPSRDRQPSQTADLRAKERRAHSADAFTTSAKQDNDSQQAWDTLNIYSPGAVTRKSWALPAKEPRRTVDMTLHQSIST